MSEKPKDDGGAAFPSAYPRSISEGMSLRDWFAGMALKALLAEDDEGTIDSCASDAYRYADAMLRERQR